MYQYHSSTKITKSEIKIPFFFRINMKSSFNHCCPLKATNVESKRLWPILRRHNNINLITNSLINHFCLLTAFIIWHPFTVKLFNGSARLMLGSGLCLNPNNDPSSRRTKYLCRQFFMCSPIRIPMVRKMYKMQTEFLTKRKVFVK